MNGLLQARLDILWRAKCNISNPSVKIRRPWPFKGGTSPLERSKYCVI